MSERTTSLSGEHKEVRRETPYELRPVARRRAWTLSQMFRFHLEQGDTPRLFEVAKLAAKAHLQDPAGGLDCYGDPVEVFITQLDGGTGELIGERLFQELGIETVWDLAQFTRAEVGELSQISEERLKWLDKLLAKHRYKWKTVNVFAETAEPKTPTVPGEDRES